MDELSRNSINRLSSDELNTGFEQEVQMARAVYLAKHEAFEACEALALAERALLRAGRPAEAASVAALFETLEARLMVR